MFIMMFSSFAKTFYDVDIDHEYQQPPYINLIVS